MLIESKSQELIPQIAYCTLTATPLKSSIGKVIAAAINIQTERSE